MMDDESPMGTVERRLDQLTERVGELHADVSVLKSDVSVLTSDVSGLKSDVSGLRSEMTDLRTGLAAVDQRVHGLRVLYEHHDSRFDQVFEVLAEHGRKLDSLISQRKELTDLTEFVRLVANNHEARIKSLETRNQ